MNKADASQEVLLWTDLENTDPIPCLRCGLLAEPFLNKDSVLFLAVLGLYCSAGFSLVAEGVGRTLVASLRWLPLPRATGAVALGLQQLSQSGRGCPQHVESPQTRGQPRVPALAAGF